ncbi:TPA: helix-turn-helix domain-containing protein [Pseudomonas putida]|uniref:helix-turn-helix domain-containing protein n=1 Tax=unclassified Pseudomonas TaxID=196821 RepID=UPI0008380054|nr:MULTISPECIES: AraC family transcriptional regulator [unclassified Pseudomonas]QIH07424.1 helix-turn-helix domain-containing protein [Pseudomonas sp. BIOMIG1BAC]
MAIQPLGYQPRASYSLDLEVFNLTDLRNRCSRAKVRTTHRYEFHTLVCVTQGICTQMVDFRPVACAPGSLLVLRPGQAHNFGLEENWEGWILLFRPEFVLPTSTTSRDLKFAVDLKRLPEHFVLGDNDLRTVTGTIEQIHMDTQLNATLNDVHTLLHHQLYALLTRLSILQACQQSQDTVIAPALQRFKRFQELVEERFAQSHQVADYASQLGYTEKSLSRAVMAAMGVTSKAFIASRVALEAKRLLVHTNVPVASIALHLGFDEPTNFSKFFRREVHCTPAEFRRRKTTENSLI